MLDYVQEQLQSMVANARATSNRYGRANDDQRAFVEALVMAIADPGLLVSDNDDTATEPKKKTPSTIARIKLFGLPKSTGYHLFKKLTKKIGGANKIPGTFNRNAHLALR